MSNVIPVNFTRSKSTDRVIAALKRLERAMDANAAQTEQFVERAALLEQLSAALAKDYERVRK